MSTPFVMRDTLALADTLGLKAALLPPWYDVDAAAELERLRVELAASSEDTARHTRSLLAEIGASGWMSR
jgi:hypothetical protein